MDVNLAGLIANVARFEKALAGGLFLYLMAVLIYLASTLLWGLRWYIILRRLGSYPSYSNVYVAIMGGILFNNITPSLKFGGETFRAGWIRTTEKIPTERSIVSIVYERLTEVPGVILVLLIAIIAGYGDLLHSSLSLNYILVPFGLTIPTWLKERISTIRARFRGDAVNLLKDWELTTFSVAIGIVIWLQDVARFYLIAASLGVKLSVVEAAVLSIAYLVFGMGPTPAGVGFVEGGLVSVLATMGVPLGKASLIVLGERFISSVLASLLGFVLVILKGGIKLFKEVARIAREEGTNWKR